jgi:hypothetical protein
MSSLRCVRVFVDSMVHGVNWLNQTTWPPACSIRSSRFSGGADAPNRHVREAWYSADDEEDPIDVRCLGAAICGVGGRPLICDTGIVNRAIAGKAWNAP